jgi:hypothetical protein
MMRVLQNRALKRIFGSERDEVCKVWTDMRFEEL